MSYSCKYCHKEFEKSYQVAAHTSMCKLNPNYKLNRIKVESKESNEKRKNTRIKNDPYHCERKEFELKCEKCGKPYTLILTQCQYDKGKYRKNCSRSCANGRPHTEDEKRHISEGVKKSEIFQKNNIIGIQKRCKRHDINLSCIYFLSKDEINRRLNLFKKCPVCNNNINEYKIKGNSIIKNGAIYCSDECRKKAISIQNKGKCGGYRENSVRSYKSGTYHGIHCDSSWELAFVIWNEEHGHIIERCHEVRTYEYNGETKEFHPDFLVDKKELVEIKGINDDIAKAKLLYNQDVKFLYRNDMKEYLDYVKEKYDGDNFIKLYEKRDKERGIGSVATAPHCL